MTATDLLTAHSLLRKRMRKIQYNGREHGDRFLLVWRLVCKYDTELNRAIKFKRQWNIQ